MPLILAIEPDRRQASQLSALVRGRLRAELVLAESAQRALDALGDRVPDLILTSPLLSSKDDAALDERLRALNAAAAHVQTLTIPVLASGRPRAASNGRGVLSALRRDRAKRATLQGCDPEVFAEQCKDYLDRAETDRLAHLAEQRSPVAVPPPAAQPRPAARSKSITEPRPSVGVQTTIKAPPAIAAQPAVEAQPAIGATPAIASPPAIEAQPVIEAPPAIASPPAIEAPRATKRSARRHKSAAEQHPKTHRPLATPRAKDHRDDRDDEAPASLIAAVAELEALEAQTAEPSTESEAVQTVETISPDPAPPNSSPIDLARGPSLDSSVDRVLVDAGMLDIAALDPDDMQPRQNVGGDASQNVDAEARKDIGDALELDLTSLFDEAEEASGSRHLKDDQPKVYELDAAALDPVSIDIEAVAPVPEEQPQRHMESLEEQPPAVIAALNDSELYMPLPWTSAHWPSLGSHVAEAREDPEEWMDIIEALRRDAQPVRLSHSAVAQRQSSRKKKARRSQPAVQDEWGFFDPQQCGFAALLAKLEEITDQEDGSTA